MEVLWLVSWYPCKLNPLSGDFIKRHAEAVSLYEDVQVVFVIHDTNGKITNDVLVEESSQGRLKETIIYYYLKPSGWKLFDKFRSYEKYLKVFKLHVLEIIRVKKPSLAHVHVGMHAGMIALWLKSKYQMPFIISEHWSGFLDEVKGGYKSQPYYLKFVWKRIVSKATSISAVSNYLEESLKKHFKINNSCTIPNVVNDNIFSYRPGESQHYEKFIYISTLDSLKNPLMVLKAFEMILKIHPGAQLNVVGPHGNRYNDWLTKNHLENNIVFFDEMPQIELARLIIKSDALLLYSSHETFGCVVIEANACGVPVIASDIPSMRETVQEGVNGFFAPPQSAEALAATILKFMEEKPHIDKFAISRMAVSKYSYGVVGKMFSNWYNEVTQ